jgi:hypothetical protein
VQKPAGTDQQVHEFWVKMFPSKPPMPTFVTADFGRVYGKFYHQNVVYYKSLYFY